MPFFVYVFIPQSAEKTTGRLARDEAEDLRIALFKTLLGVEFDSGMVRFKR